MIGETWSCNDCRALEMPPSSCVGCSRPLCAHWSWLTSRTVCFTCYMMGFPPQSGQLPLTVAEREEFLSAMSRLPDAG
jgi:hypothetical protein